jgi:hypothetical protein
MRADLRMLLALTCLGLAYYRRYVFHRMDASASANSPPGFPPLTEVVMERTKEAGFTRKGRS